MGRHALQTYSDDPEEQSGYCSALMKSGWLMVFKEPPVLFRLCAVVVINDWVVVFLISFDSKNAYSITKPG